MASGFEIVCLDESVAIRRSYVWLDGLRRSFRVGHRCLPAKGSAAMISVDPPVAFRIAPGRGGFRLLGDFRRGNYRIKIVSGLTTVDGGVLKSDFVAMARVGVRAPHLEFIETGRYLPKNSWKSLRFRHRNVGEVNLEVRQIRPENLAFWLSSGSESASLRDSDVVVRRSLRVRAPSDVMETGSLDVENLVGAKFRGVLQVQLQSPGTKAVTRLMVSDMNLLAKRSLQQPAKDKRPAEYGYKVWSTAIHTHQALAGTLMELVAPSGRIIDSCMTGADGGQPSDRRRCFGSSNRHGDHRQARNGFNLSSV